MDWKPIETVPEHGVDVLVWFPEDAYDEGRVVLSYWNQALDCHEFQLVVGCAPPTHWMPLPSPPDPNP